MEVKILQAVSLGEEMESEESEGKKNPEKLMLLNFTILDCMLEHKVSYHRGHLRKR